MQRIIISGIQPNNTGAGLLLQELAKYNLIFYKISKVSNRTILENILKFELPWKLILNNFWVYSKLNLVFFYCSVYFIRKKKVILYFYQGIPNYILNRIIKNNEISIFVLDNSFFCIESYNFNKLDNSECVLCISDNRKRLDVCKPFPLNIKISYADKKNELIYNNKSNITFLCQNKSQEHLLKLHFSKNIQTKIIGMITPEILAQDNAIGYNKTLQITEDYIVYHGTNHNAKGIRYVLQLAPLLENIKILIPISKEVIINTHPDLKIIEGNIIFHEMSWNNGLKEAVEKARLVLCPSIWSSPVEGALLKSIIYNGNVAVFNNKFGFQSEITDDIVLKLDQDIEASANKIIYFLATKSSLKENANNWLNNYIKNTKYKFKNFFENDNN